MYDIILRVEVVLLTLVVGWLGVISWLGLRGWWKFSQFVRPSGEGQPSPLGLFIQSAAQVVATQVMLSVKGTFMGQASAISRAQQGIEQDIATDNLAEKSPALGLLLEAFPSLKRRVTKSAVARMALGNLNLDRLIGGQKNGSKEAETSETKFKL